jgi:microcystin degradation protein MlrC
MKRVAIGGLVHETHTFASVKTTLADFEKSLFRAGPSLLDTMRGTRSAIGGMIQAAEVEGWELLPIAYATAMPSGTVTAAAYDRVLGELLDGLSTIRELDGVLLALHGAMVTENHLDAETHILSAVRDIVGPTVPVVVELDMHGNISPELVLLVDALVAFDTNPHVDPYQRGQEAVSILKRIMNGEIKPIAGYAHPPLMLAPQATGTADLPLRAVHERAAQMETEDDVICVAVMGGFAYSDTAFTGVSLIVTTNDNATKAQRYADELAEIVMANKDAALPDFLSPDAAVNKAMQMPGRPIILVDSADNIGGGTPGDGTDALKAMLQAGAQDGAVVLADATAAAACHAAGVGAELTLTVGGKTDQWHGEPVAVTGVVRGLTDGVFICELPENHFASFFGDRVDMGPTAWLRVDGVNLILTTYKIPPFDLGQLRHIGVIPEQQKMIVVKSAVAYRAAYMPIAAGVVEMDTAGLCTANLSRFPYQHITRPIYPLDQ